jgi:hypothetical protein
MRTFILLFLLGFFISCASNQGMVVDPKESTVNPDQSGRLR